MADRAKKKEKHRLKRLKKQREARKASSLSPVRRVLMAGGALECWINSNWPDEGMADLLVLGHAGGGQYTAASFLIDTFCVGLKDVFGRPGISRLDFEKNILEPTREKMPLVKISADEARRMVAGGIKFSRQNGFRLPPHYDRWTAILGPLDIEHADISDFGYEGDKLLYTGTRQFLSQRLIGCTPEEFLQRGDVELMMRAGEFPAEMLPSEDEDFEDEEMEEEQSEGPALELDEEAEEQFKEAMDETLDRMVEATRRWCQQRGVAPADRLDDGIAIVMIAGAYGLAQATENPPVSGRALLEQQVEKVLEQQPPDEREALRPAIAQAMEFVDAYPDPDVAMKELGLPPLVAPEDDIPDDEIRS